METPMNSTYERLKQQLRMAYEEDLQNLEKAFHNGHSQASAPLTRKKYERVKLVKGEIEQTVLEVAQAFGGVAFSTNELLQAVRAHNPAIYRRLKKHNSTSACLSGLRADGKVMRELSSEGDASWKAC